MENKNMIWAFVAVGLVAAFLFGAFALSQNSARAEKLAAQKANEPEYLNMPVKVPAQQYAQPQTNALPQNGQAGQTKNILLGVGYGGAYDPAQISVDLGDNVVIEGDMSRLRGCARALVIPAFGIAKVFSAADNKVEFTASKKGIFPFSCSMGMVRGTLIVQ